MRLIQCISRMDMGGIGVGKDDSWPDFRPERRNPFGHLYLYDQMMKTFGMLVFSLSPFCSVLSLDLRLISVMWCFVRCLGLGE